ncbi:pyridoxamine 5'-phosphate oxidase family protein [Microtetraspora sp. AC03309]|uniref:pyridoxamine 5'-phosphate oxidase family protein n=1 Tax=Microtetraspora sp. AC03309 TaxID=2779376 RepID=UPI001E35146D|nr:pyridoxamine 5'-phosphate oxidase family protein [Microtetraspora sp. AC03309]MCC5574164.1 pyridoxamine 5'-phosphate oxidase family protein [Microtetraspora sp. AC03309]
MTWWQDFENEASEFAARVRARFESAKHCTMATLRKDGSPRISGTEVGFSGGDLRLGSMPGSLKALDLRRDPRLALHGPMSDMPEENPSAYPGDVKIAGIAHELGDPAQLTESHFFRIEITEVVLVRVAESNDHVVIESWHPGRGHETRTRR